MSLDTDPTDRPVPPTPVRLVDAGWAVLDELDLSRSLGGATTAAIAERAGVTTGSFFHHFATAATFTDALALAYLEDDPPVPDSLNELLAALDDQALSSLLRDSMAATWRNAIDAADVAAEFRGEMRLWALHRTKLSRPNGDYATVADILRQRYRTREHPVAAVWSDLLDTVGRTTIEPFTPERLATAFTALFQGLILRQAVEPDAVDDDLFCDLTSVLVASLSQPKGSNQRLADVVGPISLDHGRTPQARAGARRRRATRARILAASTGLFTDGWESISASDIAERSRVSVQTVSNQFQSVRAVAASTFAAHLPDLVTEAEAGLDLEDFLTFLAEAVSRDPHTARALLAERIATTLHRGSHRAVFDIRTEVPLGDLVVDGVKRLLTDEPQSSVDQSAAALDPEVPQADETALDDTADVLVDFVLSHAATRPGRSAETAALAMTLLRAILEGASRSSAG